MSSYAEIVIGDGEEVIIRRPTCKQAIEDGVKLIKSQGGDSIHIELLEMQTATKKITKKDFPFEEFKEVEENAHLYISVVVKLIRKTKEERKKEKIVKYTKEGTIFLRRFFGSL